MECEQINLFSNVEGYEEVIAVDSFIEKYEFCYGKNHIDFTRKTLEMAIRDCLFSPAEVWKPIALYLHHDENFFSTKCCMHFSSGCTAEVLQENYCLLPWDITNPIYHYIQKSTLNSSLGYSFDNFFDKKESGIIFIMRCNAKAEVFLILKDASDESILDALFNVRDCFEAEREAFIKRCEEEPQEERNLGGSQGYQQMMFEMLGDRDYDRFEENQHEELKRKIAYAIFGPPKEENYEEKIKKIIESHYNVIRTQNNLYSKWKDEIVVSFIFNCFEPLEKEKQKKQKSCSEYNPENDLGVCPIFVLKKCHSDKNGYRSDTCRIFIDHENRVYESWENYINKNRLHKCVMVLPKDGHYQGDENGNVLLERYYSPACNLGKKALKVADTTACGLGLAAGGITLAAAIPAIAVAPIVLAGAGIAGIGAGVYSLVRSSTSLYDMKKHKQDIAITNPEARGAYLNIVAGSIGFVGAGATAAVSKYAAEGVNIGKSAQYAVNAINGANLTIGATALGHSAYQIISDWRNGEAPSSLALVQFASSVLFFGNAVYNFKTAGTIIEESQAKTISAYQKELRSNNHRKVFNKLYKETVRMNGGDTKAAQAEIITTVRNIPNKDEVFAILHRNNKLFNQNGIKFSASGSEIKLNGESFDLGTFSSLSKPEKLQMLIDLPATPLSQEANVSSSVNVNNLLKEVNITDCIAFGQRLISNVRTVSDLVSFLLAEFKINIKKKIMYIAKTFVDRLIKLDIDFIDFLTTKMRNVSEPFIPILKIVLCFLKEYAEKYESEYEESKRQAQTEPGFNEEEFDSKYFILPGTIRRANFFLERVIFLVTGDVKAFDLFLHEMVEYFMNMITSQIVYSVQQRKQEAISSAHRGKNKVPTKCKVCTGYTFLT